MTPDQFWDLTPADLVPYIDARIKWHEEQTRMENERFGLIAATLQNGIPTGGLKKNARTHQPSDYFKRGKPSVVKGPQDKQAILERSWSALMGWCNRGKS